MTWLAKISQSVRTFVNPEKADRELDDELRFHLEMQTEANVSAGMSPEQARYAALRSFGGVDQTKEECRDVRALAFLETFLLNLKVAARTIAKRRRFSLTVIFPLALGIGSCTAMFSMIETVLLNPVPFDQPEQLVVLNERTGLSDTRVSYPDYEDWQRMSRSFQGLAARMFEIFTVTGLGEPEHVEGSHVSWELFQALRVKPALGRVFLPGEDRPGVPPTAIITDSFWQRHFNSSTDVLGKPLMLGGTPYTIIGVMPQGFRYPVNHVKGEIFLPLGLTVDEFLSDRNFRRGIQVLGRLRTGVSIEQAHQEMDLIMTRLSHQYPASNKETTATLSLLTDEMTREVRPIILILSAAVLLLLLIVCANVANLFLADSTARQMETTLREAIGATRVQLIGQFLAESGLLAAVGAVGGIVIAWVSLRGVSALVPFSVPRGDEIQINGYALLFTLLLTVLITLLFGMLRGFHGSGLDVFKVLRPGAHASSCRPNRIRLRNLLVVAEIGLALLLLIAAGLTVSSVVRLVNTSPGFRAEGVLTLQLLLPDNKYIDREHYSGWFEQLVGRIRSIPGVESVATVTTVPFGQQRWEDKFATEGKVYSRLEDMPAAELASITPDYFQTLSIPLVRGRAFSTRDRLSSPNVVIVDETLARLEFPEEDAIGKTIRLGGRPSAPKRQVVGIVGNIKRHGVDRASRMQIYIPYLQRPVKFQTLLVKAPRDQGSRILPLIRAKVRELDPDQAIYNIHWMEDLIRASSAQKRSVMIVLSIFAAASLLLSAVGLYGVISYSIAQRRHELGIRLALGASVTDIVTMILKETAILAACGIGLGLLAAVATTRAMSSFLFGVSPLDPVIIIAACLTVGTASLAASSVPVWRATRVDPMLALRTE